MTNLRYFTVVCSWCGWLMNKFVINSNCDQISHGMCDVCLAAEIARWEAAEPASWFEPDLGEAGA